MPRMPPTTSFEFGDVVLVAFPFTDQSASKKRPAVVVSSDAYHRWRVDMLVMVVTGQLGTRRAGDLEIRNWQAAGLLKPSLVKPVVATLERRLALKKLGRLAAPDRQALGEAIRLVFGP
jgi:mRNA interferase MazF